LNEVSYLEAIDAYQRWARAVAAKQIPMLGEDDEPNPLISLAAKAVQIHEHRIEKGLAPRGELILAVHSLATLCKIRTLQSALTNVAEQISGVKGMTKLEQMTKHARALLDAGNLDAAEALIDEITKRLKHKVTVESGDDGEDGDYSDVISPSLDAKNTDRENNDGDNGETMDDEEEDDTDDEKSVSKASINEVVRTHSEANRPGSLSASRHPSSSNARHKFLGLVQDIRNKHGVPQTEAMAIARQYHPDTFADYQKQEASPRSIGKAAPLTFEDHVAREMAKGCTEQVGQQRVMQMYGNTLLRTDIKKSEIAGAVLEDAANEIWKADASMSRTEALRAARRANPTLYKRMQR
jgi:hypothetical protein